MKSLPSHGANNVQVNDLSGLGNAININDSRGHICKHCQLEMANSPYRAMKKRNRK